jgi:uncharacterized protein YegJ (DUF2314 family)
MNPIRLPVILHLGTLTLACLLALSLSPAAASAEGAATQVKSAKVAKVAKVAKARHATQAAKPASPPASAASAASQAEQEGIEPVEYNPDDPEMIQAAAQAQAELPRFFKATGTPGAQVSNAGVRVKIRDGALSEFVWVMPFQAKDEAGQQFTGTVSDIARRVRKVKTGQELSFSRADIVDWLYSDLHTGRMEGNFTTCVLLRKAPAEERALLKRSYGLDCER